jgi:rod shape-determining protein MreD
MIATGLLVGAMLAQVVLVNRLTLPMDAAPDLVLLVVTGYGLTRGPVRGAVVGFAAGLVADLLPPVAHVMGQYALVYCVAGFVAGRLGTERGSGGTVIAAIACAVAGPVLAATAGGLVGDPRITLSSMIGTLPAVVACNLVAAPVVVWGVTRLLGERSEAALRPAYGRGGWA